jgi:predicted N-acyltransferase
LGVGYEVEIAPSLANVAAPEWDALGNPNDPFTEHAFLRLLETSGSVGPERTGWRPCHVLVRRSGELVAAMPLYLKRHSYGEFIFDFGWAQAAYRAGIDYYPKLVSAVPLTPATGPRLLTHPAHPRKELARTLVAAATDLMHQLRASSLHVLFCTAEEQQLLVEAGLSARLSYQYHFLNAGLYGSFDDVVSALRNASRKQVRKERERARELGFALSMRPVSELSPGDVEALWDFYNRTLDQHGSEPYLTRGFFMGLPKNPRAYAALAHAPEEGGETIAGALFFHKGDALFGRYWGARRELPMLHFELCYYLPMAWGLERGLRRFEAGAQGEHKIKRGFLPNACYSAHGAAHPALDRAIAEFVVQEAGYVRRQMELTAEATPFKRSGE